MNWGKIKVGFWSAIGGAIVLAIIGFNWGGWVTGGTAEGMAVEAVVDRLTLICVAQFNQDPEKAQKLKELKETDFWKRESYVEKQGCQQCPVRRNPIARLPPSVPARLCSASSGTEPPNPD